MTGKSSVANDLHNFSCATPEQAAIRFLRTHGMYYKDLKPRKMLEDFLAGMAQDYAAWQSSRRMIPLRIGSYQEPSRREMVTVIDIGGTNVRAAIAVYEPGLGLRIEQLHSFPTPGIAEATDVSGFFDAIAEGVLAFSPLASRIGICFSFASIPAAGRDAIVAAGGKQLKVRDLIGKKVGENFRQALLRRGIDTAAPVTVINDTQAAALGGYAHLSAKTYSGYIGFIYGTGMNICYQEPDGAWINTEAGAYCCFPTGSLDDAYDATLIDIGADRLEKMVSGGYQGGLMNYILASAADEGYISRKTIQALHIPGASPVSPSALMLTARDISEFSHHPAGDGRIARACACEADRAFLCSVFDLITERSALLCAAALTGCLLRSGLGGDPAHPVCITAEGSTYLGQKDFADKLKKQMDSLAGESFHLHYAFHTIPDVILKGIFAACLSA